MSNATMREHVGEKVHRAIAADHEGLVKIHKTCMGKATDGVANDFHKAAMDHHQERADFHNQCADEMQDAAKAVEAANLAKAHDTTNALDMDALAVKIAGLLKNTMVPDDIHGVIPTFPGVTAVPRVGQRHAAPQAPNVPIEFEQLIKLDD